MVMPASLAPWSGTRVATASTPLSNRLWNLDWSRLAPWQFGDVTVEYVAFDHVLPFIAEHHPLIFGAGGGPEERFFAEPMTDAKRRFCAEMDVFAFRHDGRIVGTWLSHPTDWSSYYLRNVAFLPEYQGRGLSAALFRALRGPLAAAGVARIESDVSPTNVPSLRVNLAEGFVVTGTQNTERWGTFVRLTYFVSPDAESVFVRQFSGVATKLRAKRNT